MGGTLANASAVDGPAVTTAISDLPNAGGANPLLAREVFRRGLAVGYLVPGSSLVCEVIVVSSRPAQSLCTTTAVAEQKGIVQASVIPGGFELRGVLPASARNITLMDAAGHATALNVNNTEGLDVVESTAPARLDFTASGGPQSVEFLPTPPAPPAPASP